MEKICSMLHRRLRPTSRLLAFFMFVCFLWMIYVIKIQLEFQTQHVDKDYLRRKIIELSKEYVRVVADRKEKVFGIDGQRTGIELQDKEQPIGILLQNLLDRLHTLEERVENVVAQNSQDFSGLIKQVDSLKKAITVNLNSHDLFVQQCKVPNNSNYPNCASKVKWLEEHWKSDIKYSKNGVNGSLCSFLHYLSEVEDFCPTSQKYIKSRDCIVPSEQDFPQCGEKVKWILKHWRTDVKFSSNAVNGSLCSILRYLSEVETWCPLLPGRQETHKDDCKVPQDKAFPNCAAKVAWMKSSWKTDRCYAQDYGVNGTICSFLSYLSEVESWCPTFSGRRSVREEEAGNSAEKVNIRDTSMPKLLDKLTRVLAESRLSWIRSRVAFMYSYWVNGLKELQARVNVTDKAIKKVVIHIGVLAEEKKFHFAQTAGKGGPLGELVQWSDLITSLFVLGHDIRVTVDHMELLSALDVNAARSCPPRGGHRILDLIFTDYYGLQFLKRKAKGIMELYRCRLRIVDSFGTEAQFNYDGQLPRYATSVKDVRGITNAFGKNNLNLKQYMTMFPHSPDNTFLGFVVDSKTNVPKSMNKKPKAVAYGKHYYMWKDLKNRAFLDVIYEHFEIHATTGGLPLNEVKAYLPNYVINHGVLTPHGVQQLLLESKIFIGLGFPYEGPAPLEAIAQGCFFINPKFNPPKNRANTIFFRGKPTFRSLTSQHPYAEEFIGGPRVLTVDINDLNAVKNAVKTILDSQSSPYLPFEYTHEGMLERVNALVHNLDVCNRDSKWPPLTSRKVFSGKDGQSCKDVCLEKGLICEPAYFESINNQLFLSKSTFPCKGDSTVTRHSLVAPAYVGQEKLCVLQANPALYSCTMSYSSIRRVCPCRDYRKGQVALCKTCY